MADKKISELDQALLLNNDADFPLSQDNAGEPTTFRAKLTQLATKIAEDMTFSNLQTTSKKLVGAINELSHLGSPIIIGTTAPTSSQGADGNIYVQYTAGTGGADDEVDGIYVKIDGAWCEISTGGGSGTTDYEDLSNKPQVNSIELVGNKSLDDLGIMPASLSKTVSGAIAHITDGADNVPVKSLVSEIVAVESGSGEKSPDNPYTISGFDNGVITRCGKNLANFTDGYGISTSGEIVTNVKRTSTVMPIKVDNTKPYVFTFTGSNIVGAYAVWNNNTLVRRITGFGGGAIDVSGGNLVYLSCYNSAESSSTPATTKADCTPQLEQNTTATTYEAYKGNTYAFAFGQTVYGGHFDNKGNLVVTHGFYTFTGNENFGSLSGNRIVYTGLTDIYVPSVGEDGILTCSHYQEAISGGASINNSVYKATENVAIVFRDDTKGTSTTNFANYLATQYANGTPVQVAYKLATPITLSITSQDIPTLLGENNIFSNTGDVEVNYYINNSDDIVDLIKSVGTGGFQPVIYSTEEREIGVWKDGKPLYEKTLNLNVTNTGDIFDISNLHIDTMIQVAGFIHQTGGNNPSVPYSSSPNDYALPYYSFSDDSIHVIFAGSYNQTIWVITVRYTKTTDTAGSGQWTPQGVPTHHYSEDEQVVGTWIDGKTLYEKTVIITNAGKDASYDLGITDFDTSFVYDGSFGGNGIIPYLHGSFPDNSIGGFLDDTGSSLAWAFRSGSQVPATISGFITVRYTKSST